jgi:NAD-dependent deacetylase
VSSAALPAVIESALERPGGCIFLTGAGISAESGVPTFRGNDGYWVVGSRNYHARELATRAAFSRMPEAVWSWYLHRLRVCRGAHPNAAHEAIAALAGPLGERFLLITQNVDGLHLRAKSPVERTYEIHGNISLMRCGAACGNELLAVPSDALGEPPQGGLARWLTCSACGGWMRPHVLWFDECYDEPLFRFESSLRAARRAALLVVIGTTGSTNLPLAIGELAASRRVPMIVINPEPNPFSVLVAGRSECAYLEGSAGEWMPRVAQHVLAAL